MIQPSGLPGLRQATTNPTTAKAAENQNGTEPLLLFMLWWARAASDGSAISSASTTPANTAAMAGEARRMACAGPAAIYAPPMNGTLRRNRSGNVTAADQERIWSRLRARLGYWASA